MQAFHEYMQDYKLEMRKGTISKAYKGLMEYILDLKTQLKNRHPDYYVSGSLYFGYMDMTYFSFFSEAIKRRDLKIALVFIHESFRFEVWLAGVNKQVQTRYWKLFKDSGWEKYPVVATTQGADAIIEHVLVADPEFRDLPALSAQIENRTMRFIAEIESFLSEHEAP